MTYGQTYNFWIYLMGYFMSVMCIYNLWEYCHHNRTQNGKSTDFDQMEDEIDGNSSQDKLNDSRASIIGVQVDQGNIDKQQFKQMVLDVKGGNNLTGGGEDVTVRRTQLK